MSKLSKLRYLDLSFNDLNESIVPYLIRLSSLKTLILAGNKFHGELPLNGRYSVLCFIYNKEQQWRNKLLDFLIYLYILITELSRLRRLEILDLSFNMFTGDISSKVKEWNSLTEISLSDNKLNSTSFTGKSYDVFQIILFITMNVLLINLYIQLIHNENAFFTYFQDYVQ